MITVRCHTVMGHVAVSLWCMSHGEAHGHCLWSGKTWVQTDDPLELMDALQGAVTRVRYALLRGELEGWSDDCGT